MLICGLTAAGADAWLLRTSNHPAYICPRKIPGRSGAGAPGKPGDAVVIARTSISTIRRAGLRGITTQKLQSGWRTHFLKGGRRHNRGRVKKRWEHEHAFARRRYNLAAEIWASPRWR